jgi:hypothetical protein
MHAPAADSDDNDGCNCEEQVPSGKIFIVCHIWFSLTLLWPCAQTSWRVMNKKPPLATSLNRLRLDVKSFFERRLVCAIFFNGRIACCLRLRRAQRPLANNAACRCCLPIDRKGSALGLFVFAAQWPARQYLCLRFDCHPCGQQRKTRGLDGVASSFPVGLFHPLQCAGLARRSLSL